jgi:hypothetical protein
MTQSNSLLLCALQPSQEDSLKGAIHVRSNVVEIWELTPIVARVGRIAQLLKDSLYYGEEEELDLGEVSNEQYDEAVIVTLNDHRIIVPRQMKKYTPQQVASIVQASPKELQEGITKSKVVLLDGG